MFLPLILPYKNSEFQGENKRSQCAEGDILHSLFKRGWKFETEKRINRVIAFSTLLFSLGSTGEFSKAKATAPITIENPKPEGKKLSLWYNEPAKDWEKQALPIGNGYMGGMVFGGVQQERIQFNEKRFGLADQAVQVSIRTGIVMGQRVT